MTLHELIELNERLQKQEMTLEEWKRVVFEAYFRQGQQPATQNPKHPNSAPRQAGLDDLLPSSEIISPAE